MIMIGRFCLTAMNPAILSSQIQVTCIKQIRDNADELPVWGEFFTDFLSAETAEYMKQMFGVYE